MNKEFISYNQALELKELGFDEPCLDKYDPRFEKLSSNMETWSNEHYPETLMIPAPLYQQAFRWFREKYNLVHEIQFGSGKIWIRYGVNSFVRTLELDTNNDEFYHTYEEAEFACLNKLIEIAKGGEQ